MKNLFLILTFLLMPTAVIAQSEPAKTIVEDEDEAALLLGRHLFSQYGLTSGYLPGFYSEFGTGAISVHKKTYKVDAEHICFYPNFRYPDYIEGGYVRLKGNITKISKNNFTMNGTLESFDDDDIYKKEGDEEYCHYKGEMTFSRKGHPKYCRLQKAGDICKDNIYRYIDMFTKKIARIDPNEYCYPSAKDAANHSNDFR